MVCFSWGFRLESGTLTPKLYSERALFTNSRMNAFTINFHQMETQYVQFTFTQNMNEFMNDRSLNAFRHNTGEVFYARPTGGRPHDQMEG